MTSADRIDTARNQLTPAERRVADVVLLRPQAIAFGTVAELAELAATSGATVVRLAAKLGYTGFSELQHAVQDELATRLRPATERIREVPPSDVLGRAMATDLDNVHATLDGVDRAAFAAAVTLLADEHRPVAVLAGEASRGIGSTLVDQLGLLRPGVARLYGSEMRLAQDVARLASDAVVVAIDFKRYESWVLRFAQLARARGAVVLALTDSALSPLADLARHTFVVRMASAGPFDSHVGTLALVEALVAGAAAELQASATRRLDAVEDVWRAAGALLDGS